METKLAKNGLGTHMEFAAMFFLLISALTCFFSFFWDWHGSWLCLYQFLRFQTKCTGQCLVATQCAATLAKWSESISLHDSKTGCLDMSACYCKITTCYEVASARRWENGQVWQYQLPASCQSYVPKSTVIACILHKQTRNMCMLHDCITYWKWDCWMAFKAANLWNVITHHSNIAPFYPPLIAITTENGATDGS